MYPESEGTKHQTRVPDNLIGYRQKLKDYKGAYKCLFQECDYVAQKRGVVCSHIRRVHLGRALGCVFCPTKAWWQTRYWGEHMRDVHPTQLWYPERSSVPASQAQQSEVLLTQETLIFDPSPCTSTPVKIEPIPTEE